MQLILACRKHLKFQQVMSQLPCLSLFESFVDISCDVIFVKKHEGSFKHQREQKCHGIG